MSTGMLECHGFDAEINYAGGSGGATKITEETIENVEYSECFFAGLEAEVNSGTCDYTLREVEWDSTTGHARATWNSDRKGVRSSSWKSSH